MKHGEDSWVKELPTPAVVLNMFYTGLGIARSLGERGIPVFGLTAQRRIYGNFTRRAKVVFAPDSRTQPSELLTFLTRFSEAQQQRCVIFPTRDDDVVFLNRFRRELEQYFILAIPSESALNASLNKWETYQASKRAGVPVPECWTIQNQQEINAVLPKITYPCVLKPVSAHHWRQGSNWEIVGGRKAVLIESEEQLLKEYGAISQADPHALLQQMVPGADDCLRIAAVYCDRESKITLGFNAQKLIQVPAVFGTGCIVQTASLPEVSELAARFLREIGFTGLAEVEFKWDVTSNKHKLIECNPRPWDQHSLGKACGVDLVYAAYCDLAGLTATRQSRKVGTYKWIAEDAFIRNVGRLAWHRDPDLALLLRSARGKRQYAIWCWSDPAPFLSFMFAEFFPRLALDSVKFALRRLRGYRRRNVPVQAPEVRTEKHA